MKSSITNALFVLVPTLLLIAAPGSFAGDDIIVKEGQVQAESIETSSSSATGANAVALGVGTTASGDYSTALGYNSTASGSRSLAIGYDVTASGDSCIVAGYRHGGTGVLDASSIGSMALGRTSTGTLETGGIGSIAAGNVTNGAVRASSDASVAIGYISNGGIIQTLAAGSIAVGYGNSGGYTKATGSGSIAVGYFHYGGEIEAASAGSIAVGYADYGYDVKASGPGSVAMGYAVTADLKATGTGSVAMGESVTAGANNALALGKNFTNSTASSFQVGFGQKDFEVQANKVIVPDTSSLKLPVKTTTGDPASPVEGQIYVNTSDNKVRVYADGAWRDLATW